MNALKHGMGRGGSGPPRRIPGSAERITPELDCRLEAGRRSRGELVWEMTIGDWRLRRARPLEPRLVDIEPANPEAWC